MAAKQVITAEDIRLARRTGQKTLQVLPGAIVTQQAREDAAKYGVELRPVTGTATAPTQPQTFQQQVSYMHNAQHTGGADMRLPFQVGNAAPVGIPMVPAQPVAYAAPAVQTPAAPVQEKSCQCGSHEKTLDLASADLFGEVRRQVLSALPQGVNPAVVDDLIRKALSEKGPGCGGGCLNCAKREAGTSASPAGGPAWLENAPGVTRVNMKALDFNGGNNGKVGMMQVLGDAGKPTAGYVDFADNAFQWTFEKPEVLVVLEGDLRITSGTGVLHAGPGDMCAMDAGVSVTLEARGKVKYTTIAMA